MQDVVIVGEAVAGESAKTRKALEKAIKQVNLSTFDIIELLQKVRIGHMYTTPTFEDYLKTLDFKFQTLKYMARIGDFMTATGATRVEAEAVGVSKMRPISRLDPKATYTNPVTNETSPIIDFVWSLMEEAKKGMTIEKLEENVRILMGEVGEKDFTWWNVRMARLVYKNVIEPALKKAGLNIGTVGVDKDGIAIEASDGRKLEVICESYNQDLSEEPEVTQ